MAGIFTRFTLRSLAQNRVRTAVTVVGIALSTALLAAVLTSVASVQQGLLERMGAWLRQRRRQCCAQPSAMTRRHR